MKDDGYSTMAISRALGIPETTVRSRLKPVEEARANKYQTTANVLKEYIDNGRPYLDIGEGVEAQLGVSSTTLKKAVALLEEQGYKKSILKVEQAANPDQHTWVKVLAKEDVPYTEIYNNRDKIMSPLGTYSEDKGNTFLGIQPPLDISSNRIAINYAEQGGKDMDGVIELRPGVKDITLGDSNYAQVRISVDGTHYLKGMAIYNDRLPDGIDIRFNTNKHDDVPMLGPKDNSVLKPIKADKDNPFGSTIRQLTDDNGKVYSACNIVNDETDWDKWSKNLSSQMLSKQDPALAKRQLDLTYKEKRHEFEQLCEYTNPAIKKKLLLSFADECDSDAVHLKAAALPRQQTHVILPVKSLKDNEVYAPNYKNGEEVVLIRYPHQGTFEIPRLVVNNNNEDAKRLLGRPKNAIGINAKVAEKLSGADFDGDTVVVIPTKGQKIRTSTLRELENFDPKERYRAYPGMPEVGPKSGFNKQQEMGKISNLVTDMTLQGAPLKDIATATKHAQVIIDAEKHNLDWRRSYEENGIARLKEKYQGGANKGASSLISRANSDERVPMRKDFRPSKDIDPVTGKKIYRDSGETYYSYTKSGMTRTLTKDSNGSFYYKDKNTKEKIEVPSDSVRIKKKKNGEEYYQYSVPSKTYTVFKSSDGNFYYKDKKTKEKIQVPSDKVKSKERVEISTKLTEAYNRGQDAYSLMSGPNHEGTKMERIYAEHANRMKNLANEARKEYMATPDLKVNKSAKATYAAEVKSLDHKLNIALQNSPRERQAQLLASVYIKKVKDGNPDISNEELKKKRTQAISEARVRTGTIKRSERTIDITDREWEAIQAGAISHTKVAKILSKSDEAKIKERAMPRNKKGVTPAALTRAKAMIAAGYTQAEAAEAIGVSTSTLNKAL